MIKQRYVFACTDCGILFTVDARKSKDNICPASKSPYIDKIEGFKYD
jgi:hypothetical protein